MSADVRQAAEPIVAGPLSAHLSDRLTRRLSIEIVGELIGAGLLELPEGTEIDDFIGDLVMPPAPGEDDIRRTERVRVAGRLRDHAAGQLDRWARQAEGAAPSADYRLGWSHAVHEIMTILDVGGLGGEDR